MSRHQKGFSLIEAIVALVVFSMAAIGIYSWINTNITTLNRLSDIAATESALNQAQERLKLIDLFSEQQGRFEVDGTQVDWKADLVEPIKNGTTATGAIGLYDLGLYQITLNLTRESRTTKYIYRQVGYKQVRQMKIEGDDNARSP